MSSDPHLTADLAGTGGPVYQDRLGTGARDEFSQYARYIILAFSCYHSSALQLALHPERTNDFICSTSYNRFVPNRTAWSGIRPELKSW